MPAVALLMTVTPGAARSQTTPPSSEPATEAVETDNDPTRPIVFSVRPEFYSIDDNVHQQVVIGRYDAAMFRTRRFFGGAPGVILRFEAPIVAAQVADDHHAGLGDMYGQMLLVPYVHGRFAWVIGSGLTMPTATDTLTGGGKWAIAPIGAPLWRLTRGLFYVKVQNVTSFAGDSDRPDLNQLLITPTFLHVIARQWWILADSETKTKWVVDGETGVKSGLQVGRRIATGVGAWVKPEVWWGPHRDGKWNLKFGIIWYQPRTSPGSGSASK